jgi:hypothetical protein
MSNPSLPISSRDRHLFGAGPKRILALDGGGARGILSLAFLERVETLLAVRTGGGDAFRLADYFDLVGGTSVGSILASGVALRYRVSALIDLFREVCESVFRASWLSFGGLLAPKFSSETLQDILERELGDTTLGSEQVATGLAIVAKRLDTGSPWILHNNPRGRYFERRSAGGTFTQNKDLLLRRLVQASAAAPTYFEPQIIRVADDADGLFLDGGVSPYNNPALLLVILATSKGFAFNWKTGERDLFLLSVGTGGGRVRRDAADLESSPAGLMAVQALTSLIDDCNIHGQAMLQWMGRSTNPQLIDREVGDLTDSWPLPERLLTYTRLDLSLQRESLKRTLGVDVDDETAAQLRLMDNPSSVDRLLELGRAAAEKIVNETTLPLMFDSGVSARQPDAEARPADI